MTATTALDAQETGGDKAQQERPHGAKTGGQRSYAQVLEGRAEPMNVLRDLLPYMWPRDRPDLQRRVVAACVALVLAKVVTVSVPLAYKAAVDWLTANGA
ncbi:MAG: hypothetical protein AAFO79_09190, partial [Pseudomonadota bacterium]